MSATTILPTFAHMCVGPRRATLLIPCRSADPLVLTVVVFMRASILVRAAGPFVFARRAPAAQVRVLFVQLNVLSPRMPA